MYPADTYCTYLSLRPACQEGWSTVCTVCTWLKPTSLAGALPTRSMPRSYLAIESTWLKSLPPAESTWQESLPGYRVYLARESTWFWGEINLFGLKGSIGVPLVEAQSGSVSAEWLYSIFDIILSTHSLLVMAWDVPCLKLQLNNGGCSYWRLPLCLA
jgi:hypothetical protein